MSTLSEKLWLNKTENVRAATDKWPKSLCIRKEVWWFKIEINRLKNKTIHKTPAVIRDRKIICSKKKYTPVESTTRDKADKKNTFPFNLKNCSNVNRPIKAIVSGVISSEK